MLGKHGVQYSSLLTFAALDPADVFTPHELARATAALPQEGLDNTAETLVQALEGAGGQRPEYWGNRVKPYLRDVWPKTQNVASVSIADSFARVCVAAEDAFPEALGEVYRWLQGVAYPDRIVHRLHEVKLHKRFPEATLKLLDRIVSENAYWPPSDLEDCLRTIRTKVPELEADHRFRKLVGHLQVHGQQV